MLILAAHYGTNVNGIVLFWAAYVLTRPLGAIAENAVEKPVTIGGLGVGTVVTSAVLLSLLIALVAYQMLTNRQQTRALIPPDRDDHDMSDPADQDRIG